MCCGNGKDFVIIIIFTRLIGAAGWDRWIPARACLNGDCQDAGKGPHWPQGGEWMPSSFAVLAEF